MAALTIGLVGCNEDTPFFPPATDTGGDADTGAGSDTGGTTDTGGATDTGGTSDTGVPEVGIPDVPPADAGSDASPTDTGTDPARDAALARALAAWTAQCELETACYGYDPTNCPEYIAGYAEYMDSYSVECIDAFTEYALCVTANGECIDREFVSEECEDEYAAAEEICGV